MFVLKKFVAYWLMPLQTSLVALLVGAMLMRFERSRRAGGRLMTFGLVWLALMSNKGVGLALVSTLERQYPSQPSFRSSPPPPPLSDCAAIVVLGGGHVDQAALSPANRLSASALSRLAEGIRLSHALPAVPLWLSGPKAEAGTATHAHILAQAAGDLGLPLARIRECDTGLDTEGEAAELAQKLGRVRIALVTSAWHLPRAVKLFERAGFTVVPCPADFAAKQNDDFRWDDYLSWDLSGLERSTKAVYEYLGLAWSRLRGRA